MNTEDALQESTAVQSNLPPFYQTLAKHGLSLERGQTTTLQINVGLLCNQRCRHCHLSAGPERPENMDAETADQVIAYARRSSFQSIDITGGAPELNPNIAKLIEGLSEQTPRLMIRSNLSALNDGGHDHLLDLLQEKKVVIVASLPSLNKTQAESQRGSGTFEKSIHALQRLNKLGYGQAETGLELDLVNNPAGAFLPEPQEQMARRFHSELRQKWGIVFNNIFSFANVPLGRYRDWLIHKGNLESYMSRLVCGFNPEALSGVMCRTQVSVGWDGCLYDCDFNLARGLFMGNQRVHVSRMSGPPPAGNPIAVADHCYTCTAGAGFT